MDRLRLAKRSVLSVSSSQGMNKVVDKTRVPRTERRRLHTQVRMMNPRDSMVHSGGVAHAPLGYCPRHQLATHRHYSCRATCMSRERSVSHQTSDDPHRRTQDGGSSRLGQTASRRSERRRVVAKPRMGEKARSDASRPAERCRAVNTLSRQTVHLMRDTHILLDLDNTLFFTAHCERHHADSMLKPYLDTLSNEETKLAEQLERCLIRVWDRLVDEPYRARVSIVTNGSQEWMEHVLQHHLRRFWRVLSDQRDTDQRTGRRYPTIQWVSARTRYEHQFPEDYVAWKYYAFLDELYDPYLCGGGGAGPPSPSGLSPWQPWNPSSCGDPTSTTTERSFERATQFVLFADGPVDQRAFDLVMQIFQSNRQNRESVVGKLIAFAEVPTLQQLTYEWQQVDQNLDEWLRTPHPIHVTLTVSEQQKE